MSEITLTIDGKQVAGKSGDTILQVCERHGIYVPTLCHYQGLHDIGTCRMCIVELAGGARTGTACTTPAEDGMVVATHTPKVDTLRRQTLELLFSERNHYCMFCEASGDCELQAMAYRYGMDNVRYPGLFPAMQLDTSHPHLAMDHNRCILCRRCTRACSEQVTVGALGVRERGISSMVGADGGQPLGDSTCVSCGTCVQICPTGALFDRRSAYRGRLDDCTVVSTSCSECSLACPVKLVTRSGQVLRVDGDLASPETAGLLCEKGRYGSLNGHRERLTTPMVRKNGALEPASWDEALAATKAGLKQAPPRSVAAMISARATTESMAALRDYLQAAFDSTNVCAVGAQGVVDSAPSASLQSFANADLIVMAGEQVGAGHQVVEFVVGQAVASGTPLAIVGTAAKRLMRRAAVTLSLQEVGETLAGLADAGNAAGSLIAAAKRPVFVLGAGIGDTAVTALAGCAEGTWPRILRLGAKANSRGAAEAGLRGNGVDLSAAKAALVLAGDDAEMLDSTLTSRGSLGFLAVQATYRSPLTDLADVVLPAPAWTERTGTLTSSQGWKVVLTPAIAPPAGVRDEAAVLSALR